MNTGNKVAALVQEFIFNTPLFYYPVERRKALVPVTAKPAYIPARQAKRGITSRR